MTTTLALSNDSFKLAATTNGSGGGSAETAENVIGIISLVHLDYHASAAGGTTVSIQWIPPDEGATAITLATITGNTDLLFNIVVPQYDTSGANSTDGLPGIVGKLKLAVSSAGGALTPAVTARIVMLK